MKSKWLVGGKPRRTRHRGVGHTVILSADRNFDADDRVVGRRTQAEPIGDRALAQRVPVTLPEGIESGDWYVAVVADYDGVVGDADRTSNVAWSTSQLQVRNPTDTGLFW